MADIRGFQRDLLIVIRGLDQPNGVEIKSEIERSQDREIQKGRLYRNLSQLDDKELIVKCDQKGRTNQYALTDDGEAVLRQLREWQSMYFELDGVRG